MDPQNRRSRDQGHQSWASNHNLRAPVSASVPRYCFENDKYRFIIECVMDDGSHWELSRFYQDFYDLQIAMLRAHPEQQDPMRPEDRVLPYMPGPVTYVTDDISNKRRVFLDEYVRGLLALEPRFSRHVLVKQLFAPREGDFELDPSALQEDFRLSRASEQSYPGQTGSSGAVSRQTSHNQMHNSFAAQQRYMGGGGPYGSAGPQNSMPPPSAPDRLWNPDMQDSTDDLSRSRPNHDMRGYHQHSSKSRDNWAPPDPRTQKLKFWFLGDCKKSRVQSFGINDVKRAIRINVASHNPEGRDVEVVHYYDEEGRLRNDREVICTTDQHIQEAYFVTDNKPVFCARLL